MITQDPATPVAVPAARPWKGSLRNTPDSDDSSMASGTVTSTHATTPLNDDSTGSRGSRFGSANAATSARTLISGESLYTSSVTRSAKMDRVGRGPTSGMEKRPRLSRSVSTVPPNPRCLR